jgi:signal transduction histidine kinase
MAEVKPDMRVLSISTRHEQAEVILLVSDRGVGLPEGSNVFEAFFTTKSDGMGMGLSLSRSIIEAHSGRIWAEANPEGTGATFGVALRAQTSKS